VSNQHLFAVGSEGVVIDTPAVPGDYPHGEEAGGGGCGTRPACGWVAAAVTAEGNGISPLLGAELKSPDFSSPVGAPVSALKIRVCDTGRDDGRRGGHSGLEQNSAMLECGRWGLDLRLGGRPLIWASHGVWAVSSLPDFFPLIDPDWPSRPAPVWFRPV